MKYVLIVLLSGLTLSVSSQLTLHSLQEAEAYAMEHNPNLTKSKLQELVARKNYHLTLSALSPRAAVNSGLDYNYALQTQLIPAEIFGGTPGTYQEVRFGTPYNWTISLDATMPLINTTIWQNINTGLRQKEVSELQTENAEWLVKEQLSQLYYSNLMARSQQDILSSLAHLQDSLWQNGEKKYAMGFIEQTELNRLKNLKLNAEIQYENARQIYLTTNDQLKIALGLDVEKELQIQDSLPETFSKQPPVAMDPTRYPSFKTYILQERIARMNLNKEYFKLIPEFSVNFRYGQQAYRNEFSFFDPNQNWFEVGFVGLKMEWPVFAGLSRWNTIRREKLNLKIVQNDKEMHLQERKREDRELMNKLESSRRVAVTSMEMYSISRENYELAVIKYGQGFYNIDQVTNLYAEYLQSHRQYLSALYDYLVVELKLALRQTYSQSEK